MIEYKQSLNVSNAITTVKNRYEEIEKEKKRQLEEEQKKADFKIKEQEESTRQALNNFSQSNIVLDTPKVEENEEVFVLSFKVKATKTKLKELKKFLDEGEYKYE